MRGAIRHCERLWDLDHGQLGADLDDILDALSTQKEAQKRIIVSLMGGVNLLGRLLNDGLHARVPQAVLEVSHLLLRECGRPLFLGRRNTVHGAVLIGR